MVRFDFLEFNKTTIRSWSGFFFWKYDKNLVHVTWNRERNGFFGIKKAKWFLHLYSLQCMVLLKSWTPLPNFLWVNATHTCLTVFDTIAAIALQTIFLTYELTYPSVISGVECLLHGDWVNLPMIGQWPLILNLIGYSVNLHFQSDTMPMSNNFYDTTTTTGVTTRELLGNILMIDWCHQSCILDECEWMLKKYESNNHKILIRWLDPNNVNTYEVNYTQIYRSYLCYLWIILIFSLCGQT